MSDITIADVTNETALVEGTGAYDILMDAVLIHLDKQYNEGRITGSDYAQVYLGAMQSVLQESIKFVLNEEKAGYDADSAANQAQLINGQIAKIYADVALVGQQQVTESAQTVNPTGGLLLSKQELIQAQTLGFASDTKQKILKQMLEGYAVTLSISGFATAPDATKEPAIDALVYEILTDIGSTAVTNSAATPDLGAVPPP